MYTLYCYSSFFSVFHYIIAQPACNDIEQILLLEEGLFDYYVLAVNQLHQMGMAVKKTKINGRKNFGKPLQRWQSC